ncbi:unnamed protein product [Lactuca saligna]|uniref:Uncharacterized protein n=1 Tax=Lactuca saligna TaxID=75948 RepID=A0AA35ZA90_LACSI|nr:unnamed protein product [Lactuca saligna]
MRGQANEVISSLRSTLCTEKAKLEEVRTGLQVDTSEFNTSISSKIQKLQDDLSIEIKIIDALVVKTEKVKVLTIKLENDEKQINELLSKRAVVKSWVADVNTLLCDIIETRNSMITTTVKKHLAKHLHLVIAMLNWLEGVSESSSILKQNGENLKQSKKDNPKSTVKPKKDNEPKWCRPLAFLILPKAYEATVKKINVVKVTGPFETDSFPNARFKVMFLRLLVHSKLIASRTLVLRLLEVLRVRCANSHLPIFPV